MRVYLDSLISSLPTWVWSVLVLFLSVSMLGAVSLAAIVSVARRVSGGNFKLELPFGITITTVVNDND